MNCGNPSSCNNNKKITNDKLLEVNVNEYARHIRIEAMRMMLIQHRTTNVTIFSAKTYFLVVYLCFNELWKNNTPKPNYYPN